MLKRKSLFSDFRFLIFLLCYGYYGTKNNDSKEGSGIKHEDDIQEGIQIIQYFAGPLNLNRRDKQATTVTGTQLTLDTDEFNALDMLAAQEGESLTFVRLYEAVWNTGDGSLSRSAARMKLEGLIWKIKETGEGLMWIEYKPETGYSFWTKWGHCRQGRN